MAKPKNQPKPKAKAKGKAKNKTKAEDRERKKAGLAKLTKKELAATYGYAMSLVKANPELRRLFKKASNKKKGVWTKERFLAEVRNTTWFKEHAEAWRETEVLRTTDPATYKARLADVRAGVVAAAQAMGATLSSKDADRLAEQLFRSGRAGDQIAVRNALAGYVQWERSDLTGEAGAVEAELRRLAHANGVRWSAAERLKAARDIVAGRYTVDDVADRIRTTAASTFPQWADQIKAGQDAMDLAAHYRASMAAILEIPEESIDLFDPTLRNALTRTTPGTNPGKGEQAPGPMGLTEFETELRKDPRWAQTRNGRATIAQTTVGLLDAFGLRG